MREILLIMLFPNFCGFRSILNFKTLFASFEIIMKFCEYYSVVERKSNWNGKIIKLAFRHLGIPSVHLRNCLDIPFCPKSLKTWESNILLEWIRLSGQFFLQHLFTILILFWMVLPFRTPTSWTPTTWPKDCWTGRRPVRRCPITTVSSLEENPTLASIVFYHLSVFLSVSLSFSMSFFLLVEPLFFTNVI